MKRIIKKFRFAYINYKTKIKSKSKIKNKYTHKEK